MITSASNFKPNVESAHEADIHFQSFLQEPEKPQADPVPPLAPVMERRPRNNKRYKSYNTMFTKKEESKEK